MVGSYLQYAILYVGEMVDTSHLLCYNIRGENAEHLIIMPR